MNTDIRVWIINEKISKLLEEVWNAIPDEDKAIIKPNLDEIIQPITSEVDNMYNCKSKKIYLSPKLDTFPLDFIRFTIAHEFGHVYEFNSRDDDSLRQSGLKDGEIQEIHDQNADKQAEKWGYKIPSFESTDKYEDDFPEGGEFLDDDSTTSPPVTRCKNELS